MSLETYSLAFDLGGTKCAVILGRALAAEALPAALHCCRVVPVVHGESIGDHASLAVGRPPL